MVADKVITFAFLIKKVHVPKFMFSIVLILFKRLRKYFSKLHCNKTILDISTSSAIHLL